jgi:hypothetical protein
MRLRDAPGSGKYLKIVGADSAGNPPADEGYPWDPQLAAGRKVFARRCIVCHSSKQPPIEEEWQDKVAEGKVKDDDLLDFLASKEYQEWAQKAVQTREFWRDNFLSSDRRVPVTLVRTNSARSLATNAIGGHMWEDFSSNTYKELPAVGTIKCFNPYTGKQEDFTAPGGGRGYYRPASLVSIWATAPYLHNNSVGLFNNDPSVEGRMKAFDDGIRKLLVRAERTTDAQGHPLSQDELRQLAAENRWKKQRNGLSVNGSTAERLEADHGLIWRTPGETSLHIPAKNIGPLLQNTVGFEVSWLNEYPWIVPVVLLVLALLILWRAEKRLWRGLGYLVLVVAVGGAFASYYVAGQLGDLDIGPIPAGTPVNLLANVDPDAPPAEVKEALLEAYTITKKYKNDRAKLREEMASNVAPKLLKVSKCPDLVMDRGHYFAMELTETELNDLTDLLKTF